jgi:hypothetical protein
LLIRHLGIQVTSYPQGRGPIGKDARSLVTPVPRCVFTTLGLPRQLAGEISYFDRPLCATHCVLSSAASRVAGVATDGWSSKDHFAVYAMLSLRVNGDRRSWHADWGPSDESN